MATCIPTLLKNKNYINSLFFFFYKKIWLHPILLLSEKNDLLTWLITVKQPIIRGSVYPPSLSQYIYIYVIITIKKKFHSTLKFSVVTHWCRLLPNLVIVSVFCIFLFWFIFFIPIVCLEIFLRSKIFSPSILIIFELSLFYNWTHISWLVQKFQEKKGVWSLIPFCFIWFL